MFKIQVNTYGKWEDVRPSGGGDPYVFSDREQAEAIMRMCYPDLVRFHGEEKVRVVPKEGGN